MSRAPVNETPTVTTINAAMSPFGVIDFVDNQCGMGAAAAPGVAGSVVGGPPAYLDAHGIRYVPSGALEAADACPEDPADLQKSLVSMGRSASSEPAPVSQRELNSRVDDRIRRFMADAEMRGMSTRMRESAYQSDTQDRLRALRSELEYPDVPVRRSDRLRASESAGVSQSERLRASESPVSKAERLEKSAREAEHAELRDLRMKSEAALRRSERALSRRSELQRLADL